MVFLFSGQATSRKRARAAEFKISVQENNANENGIRHSDRTSLAPYANKKKPYQSLLPPVRPKQHQPTQLSLKTKANIPSTHSNQHIGRSSTSESELGLVENDYKFIEQFNRDMMDQFMEHQRRTQVRGDLRRH